MYVRHPSIPDGAMISCAKDIYAKGGLMGFWRGFSACAIRAFFANGSMFMVYEKSQTFLNQIWE